MVTKRLPALKYGDTGDAVLLLQHAMKVQGFFEKGSPRGNFLELTQEAVRYFQMTHLGPDGTNLEVTGEADDDTWWALIHPSGREQRSGIKGRGPKSLTTERRKLLAIARKEHSAGTKEIPDGSNSGDGVTKIVPRGTKPPWCCFFVSWCWHQLTGEWPLGARHGHVLTFWREADKKNTAHKKGDYAPRPGDAFVMLYRKNGRLNGRGHIGWVYSVAPDGKSFNTLEGNCGNRVKLGVRKVSQGTLVGFVNLFGDEAVADESERKLLTAADVAGEGTR
ncbi:MAG: CHAP domain-containing protein [Acidimicrobiales bacterium]